jgi:hypothetical protein
MIQQCIGMSVVFVRIVRCEISYDCSVHAIFFNTWGNESNRHRFVISVNNLKRILIKSHSKLTLIGRQLLQGLHGWKRTVWKYIHMCIKIPCREKYSYLDFELFRLVQGRCPIILCDHGDKVATSLLVIKNSGRQQIRSVDVKLRRIIAFIS